MNRLKFLFGCLLVLSISKKGLAQDQDHTRTIGKLNVSAGVGFGIHGIDSNDPNNNGDGAVTGSLRATVDYGFHKRVSIGVQAFRNGYAANKDSNDKARNTGIGAYINYNFALRPKTVWYLTSGYGYTGFVYENYAKNGKVTAQGGYASVGLGFRRYWGDYVGFFIQAEGSTYRFSRFEYEDGKTLQTSTSKDYRIFINGVELKTGLIFRL